MKPENRGASRGLPGQTTHGGYYSLTCSHYPTQPQDPGFTEKEL